MTIAASPASENPAKAITCWHTGRYGIAIGERRGLAGKTVLISSRSPRGCPQPGDEGARRLSLGDNEAPIAVKGAYLATDDGTGPEARILAVYALGSFRRVLRRRYIAERPVRLSRHQVSFWAPLPGIAPPTRCPGRARIRALSLIPILIQRVTVILATGRRISSGVQQCIASQ